MVVRDISNTTNYNTEYIDYRLMAMRFEIRDYRGAVSFVAAYDPTEVAINERKHTVCGKLDSLVRGTPVGDCVYILIHATAPTRERIDGDNKRVMAQRGHD